MSGHEKKPLVPLLRFPEFRDAGEWESKPLKFMGSFFRGLTYSADEVSEEGLLVLRSSNIQDGTLVLDKDLVFVKKTCPDDIQLRSGDIAICMSNGSKALVGKNAEFRGNYDHDLTVGAFCSIFRPSIEFSKLIFQTPKYTKFISVAIGGGNINNLKNSDLGEFEHPVPKLQPEQQKIADCLSSLDDLIAAETQKLDTLKTHKKGLMQQLFPREGENVPQLRFPEFREAGEWEEKTLGTVCDMQAGKFISASEISEKKIDGLYPCFGGNGLRGYCKTYNQSGRYSLIGRQGALCGNVNLVDGDFYATEHAVVTTPKAGISTGWLFYNLCLLNLNRFATGQAQPGLSVEVLEKVDCVVPKNKDEQQKIADCLSSLDDLITAQTQKIDALKTHKRGLMQQLFPVLDEVPA
jgi:type I restriction enzyme S subunit